MSLSFLCTNFVDALVGSRHFFSLTNREYENDFNPVIALYTSVICGCLGSCIELLPGRRLDMSANDLTSI